VPRAATARRQRARRGDVTDSIEDVSLTCVDSEPEYGARLRRASRWRDRDPRNVKHHTWGPARWRGRRRCASWGSL